MTIRIAHTSDLHIDERNRLDDTVLVLDAFFDQALAVEVDLILVAGDVFERRSTPAERNVFATFLIQAAAMCPVVCVKGNHDAAEDLDIFAKLESVFPIHVLDRPTAMPGSAVMVEVSDHRRVSPRGAGPIGILACPWFDRAHLVAGLDATVDSETSRQMTIAAARDLLTCLRAEATRLRSEGAVPILVGHVMVAGSETSTGQTLIGTSVELSPADIFDVGAAYAALGHVHLHQTWMGGQVAYSGSPRRCNFGEGREAKGWCLVTLDDNGAFLSNDFRELPTRPMLLLEEDWTTAEGRSVLVAGILPSPAFTRDAIVRFRYRVKAEDLHLVDEEKVRDLYLSAGAHEVHLEAIVEAETRVRSEEIVRVQSTAEKVDLYLAAKGITVDEAQRSRLQSKLAQLEARP